MTSKSVPFFILGNGPSLKGFDFKKLTNFSTIGMNAAYRYWDQINWYPTYYICLDDVVVKSHYQQIKKLIEESDKNGIREFFLRDGFFDLCPELINHPKIITYENFKKQNKLVFDCKHVTTGSFAARYGIYKGYKELYMLGIDESYVNFIKESERRENITLEIVKDPKSNPNYFFDGYQKKGDLYQIANHDKVYKCHCKHCQGETRRGEYLHIDAWKFIKDDLANQQFIQEYGQIRIENCNPKSNVKFFPFRQFEKIYQEVKFVNQVNSKTKPLTNTNKKHNTNAAKNGGIKLASPIRQTGGKISSIIKRLYKDDKNLKNLLESAIKIEQKIFLTVKDSSPEKADSIPFKNTNTKPKKTLILSINPDLEDEFGHYLAYDQLIHSLAIEQNKLMYSLVHKNIDDDLLKKNQFLLPCFTDKSWTIGKSTNGGNFLNELKSTFNFLKNNWQTFDNILIYFYCGSLHHAEILRHHLKAFPNAEFHINLFHDHFNKEKIQAKKEKYFITVKQLARLNNIKLYVDSPELNAFFDTTLGCLFRLWPLFSLNQVAGKKVRLKNFQSRPRSKKINILFPGNIRLSKGYDIAIAYTNFLYNSEKKKNYKVSLRQTFTSQNLEENARNSHQDFGKIHKKANLIKGNLSEIAFIELFSAADIVVLPYKVAEFGTRTSGLFCDAVINAKPIIAAKGTWMGNRIETYKNGLTFKDGDVVSLHKAVNKLTKKYDYFLENSKKIRREWISQNSYKSFFDSLLYNKNGFKYTKESILFVPGFKKQEDFLDQYRRLIWYVYPIINYVKNIYIPRDTLEIEMPLKFNISDEFDKNILKLEPEIKKKIKFFYTKDNKSWESVFPQVTTVLHWNIKYKYPNNLMQSFLSKKLRDKHLKVWKIDNKAERNEASYYSRLSMFGNPNSYEDLKDCERKFKKLYELITNNKTYKKVNIFGTGPSLKKALTEDYQFEGSLTIACNSMVNNKPLLKKLKPKIFVAADPIFHAGCSSYAEKFRSKLIKALDKYDAYFITVFRDYKIFIENLPAKYRERIIGIPFENLDKPNLDLLNNFKVKSYPNVLTLLLLPLAATFSKRIEIMGCDGRELEDDSYFWSHDDASQFNDKMKDIQNVHATFFDIDYNKYYITHCKELGDFLDYGEEKGYKFDSASFSHIKALKSRSKKKYKAT